MPVLRLATFNCENLMMRCDFAHTGIARARERLTEELEELVDED